MNHREWKEVFEPFAQARMEQAQVPGGAIGICKDGELVYFGSFGFRDVERRHPITPDTIFGIASVTKSFTCMAIMKLQEAGKLSVHDPVVSYLPEFRMPQDQFTRDVTIHHFMTHTPGMPPLPFLTSAMKRSMEQDPAVLETEPESVNESIPVVDTYEELMEQIGSFPEEVLGRPGEAFSYNNDVYGLLGAIVERVSGMSYEQYVAEHILAPAGMTHSVFTPEELAAHADVAELFTRKTRNGADEVFHAPVLHDAPAMRAAGFLKSSVADLLGYLDIFRTGGNAKGARILSPESVASMTAAHVKCDACWHYGYGLQIVPDFAGGKLIDHGGSLKGVSSQIFALPEKGITGVVLTNVDGVEVREIAVGALNLLMGRPLETPLFAFADQPLTEERLVDYAGEYTCQEWMEMSVEAKDGVCSMTMDGTTYTLRAAGNDLFVFHRRGVNIPVLFLRNEEGTVHRAVYAKRQLRKKAQ
ncbi:serine hydrolase domain-containing protein [Brevibacillus borstelensis]|uniref:serine hydrolase domain-containing protein n=1 Tax=Brevibacillus borstelensis TaxID=45462 RepID=UPI0030BCA362